MKIVYSSTDEQELEIKNLISYFYQSVFPKYFSEDEIEHFREIGVLQNVNRRYIYYGTIKAAFQIMTCLQVLSFLLEKGAECGMTPDEKQLLIHNIQLLNENGCFFPFAPENFQSAHSLQAEQALAALPANAYLI